MVKILSKLRRLGRYQKRKRKTHLSYSESYTVRVYQPNTILTPNYTLRCRYSGTQSKGETCWNVTLL
ncbi:hypothetical protein TWF506_003009 [Arthrobotrys conoides]|uniref:Uncharacterized protein n=1 Tax=Arthrobotrys conoides TaxID=74498 RepID=A0AAN8NDY4_9PEZI